MLETRMIARLAMAALLVAAAAAAPVSFAMERDSWDVVVANNAFVGHGLSTTLTLVAIGQEIREGDRLTTRDGGALVLVRGADLITMEENTQIAIADARPTSTVVEQPYGQARYQVEHKAKPHFEVDTPLLATIVKGTTFSVQSGATSGSVSVQNGRVEAVDRKTGARSSVGAGETGTVGNGKGAVSVEATPPSAGPASAPAAAPAAPSPKAPPAAPGPAKAAPAGPPANGPAGPQGAGPGGGGKSGPAGGGKAGGGPAGGGKAGGGKAGPAGGGPAGKGPGGKDGPAGPGKDK
jgi:hypothetical protein